MLTQHTKKVTNPNFLLSLSFSFFPQLVQWFAWLVGFKFFQNTSFFSSGICKILLHFSVSLRKDLNFTYPLPSLHPSAGRRSPSSKDKTFQTFIFAQQCIQMAEPSTYPDFLVLGVIWWWLSPIHIRVICLTNTSLFPFPVLSPDNLFESMVAPQFLIMSFADLLWITLWV